MKKLISLFLCATCLFVFAACGRSAVISVTFDGNGGKTASGKESITLEIRVGEDFVAPTFIRDGYVFVGWDVSLSDLEESCTVKAVWAEEGAVKTLVRFDSAGGQEYEPIYFYDGAAVPALPKPKKGYGDEENGSNDYRFLGWFWNDEVIVEKSLWTAPGDREITIVARYKKIWTDFY